MEPLGLIQIYYLAGQRYGTRPGWTTGFNLFNSTGKVTGMEKIVGSGDPGFVDAAGGNFQLQDNAPAKGFGSDGKGVPKPLPSKK